MADGDDLVLGQVNEATSTTVLNTQGPALAVTANSGIGVSGTTNDESTQSAGVYGTSNGSAGVVGESINAPGVSGGSVNAYGMVGTSTNADGVLGNGGGGANGVTGWGDLAGVAAFNFTHNEVSAYLATEFPIRRGTRRLVYWRDPCRWKFRRYRH